MNGILLMIENWMWEVLEAKSPEQKEAAIAKVEASNLDLAQKALLMKIVENNKSDNDCTP